VEPRPPRRVNPEAKYPGPEPELPNSTMVDGWGAPPKAQTGPNVPMQQRGLEEEDPVAPTGARGNTQNLPPGWEQKFTPEGKAYYEVSSNLNLDGCYVQADGCARWRSLTQVGALSVFQNHNDHTTHWDPPPAPTSVVTSVAPAPALAPPPAPPTVAHEPPPAPPTVAQQQTGISRYESRPGACESSTVSPPVVASEQQQFFLFLLRNTKKQKK
jgi:hypothetical protein